MEHIPKYYPDFDFFSKNVEGPNQSFDVIFLHMALSSFVRIKRDNVWYDIFVEERTRESLSYIDLYNSGLRHQALFIRRFLLTCSKVKNYYVISEEEKVKNSNYQHGISGVSLYQEDKDVYMQVFEKSSYETHMISEIPIAVYGSSAAQIKIANIYADESTKTDKEKVHIDTQSKKHWWELMGYAKKPFDLSEDKINKFFRERLSLVHPDSKDKIYPISDYNDLLKGYKMYRKTL